MGKVTVCYLCREGNHQKCNGFVRQVSEDRKDYCACETQMDHPKASVLNTIVYHRYSSNPSEHLMRPSIVLNEGETLVMEKINGSSSEGYLTLTGVEMPDGKCPYCLHDASDHNDARTGCAKTHCLCHRFNVEVLRVSKKSGPADATTGNIIDEGGVNHPAHYNLDPSGVECIEIVRHRNFNVGNAIKYLWRAGLKGNKDTVEDQIKDLKKVIWYVEDEIKRLS